MEDYDLLKKAVSEAMQEEMKPFYVERETHYQHHEFISKLIRWSENCQSSCLKFMANVILAGIVGLIALGFIAWGGKAFK